MKCKHEMRKSVCFHVCFDSLLIISFIFEILTVPGQADFKRASDSIDISKFHGFPVLRKISGSDVVEPVSVTYYDITVIKSGILELRQRFRC